MTLSWIHEDGIRGVAAGCDASCDAGCIKAAMVAASACTSVRGREVAEIERLRRQPRRTQL